MKEISLFAVESAITNTAAIFAPILILAYLAGPFLVNARISVIVRSKIYAGIGTISGLWSYSAFDIPDRGFEGWELLWVSLAIYVYSLIFVWPITALRQKRRDALSPPLE